MKGLAPLLAAAVVIGCGPRPYAAFDQDPLGMYGQRNARSQADDPESLFPSDIAVLNDSAIKRILSYHVSLPKVNRVAVLQLGDQLPPWWRDSEDFNRLTEDLSDSLLTTLRHSPRVGHAALLPTMLVPRQRTIPYLREAAARYQADLMVGYRTNCALFRRVRFLKRSQYRTVCSVEAVLLDTRSGIVPWTAVATRSRVFERQKEDFETREAIINAQFDATQEALSEVAQEIGRFIETVPEGGL